MLQRFQDAQRDIFDQALSELREGHKRGHWMWYIFPQLKGLGHSTAAQFYGLDGLDEARAYLQHPVLGPRLESCTDAVTALAPGTSAGQVFAYPDTLKFHSSMTLFACAAGRDSPYSEALQRFFNATPDTGTLELLGIPPSNFLRITGLSPPEH